MFFTWKCRTKWSLAGCLDRVVWLLLSEAVFGVPKLVSDMFSFVSRFVPVRLVSGRRVVSSCVVYSIVSFFVLLFSSCEWSCMVSFLSSLSCHVVSCGFFYCLVLVCIISHCLVSFCFVVLCRSEPCRVRSCISFCFVCVSGWLYLVVTLDVSCFWLRLW